MIFPVIKKKREDEKKKKEMKEEEEYGKNRESGQDHATIIIDLFVHLKC